MWERATWKDDERMTAVGLFFVLVLLVAGLVVVAYGLALWRRGVQVAHRGEQPSWPRYHVRFYTFALLFIAFDMEMAYMYPWAVVFRSMGISPTVRLPSFSPCWAWASSTRGARGPWSGPNRLATLDDCRVGHPR